MTARQLLVKPTARWTARCLATVINLAVVTRGWPPASMEQALQAQARAELAAEGMPVIRSPVARRACTILDLHQLQ